MIQSVTNLQRTKLYYSCSYCYKFLFILFLIIVPCTSTRQYRETSNISEGPKTVEPSPPLPELLSVEIFVYENGFAILNCQLPDHKDLRGVSTFWMEDGIDGTDILIARNMESYEDNLFISYSLVTNTLQMKVDKVLLKDNGKSFTCYVFDGDDVIEPMLGDENSTQVLLETYNTILRVVDGPGIEYPKCSGKPQSYPVKTFILSCCTERVVSSRFKLQWKFAASQTSVPDSQQKESSPGEGQLCVYHHVAAAHNGVSYQCFLTSAGNVKGLNRSCKIKYQKPSVSLTQMDSQQAKFKCSASYADKYTWSLGDENSHKKMEYNFVNVNSLQTGTQSVMVLNLDTVHNGTFITCTARSGDEVMGSDGIMLIMGRPSAKEQSMTLILGIVLGLVAALLAIILVIYLIKMNALQKCCAENEFPSLEFRTIVRMRGAQGSGNGPSSYYVVQSTNAGTSGSMHPLMTERDSTNSRLSTSGYQSDNDSVQGVGAVGGVSFPGNYYELRKPPRPGGPVRGATCRDYYNDPSFGPGPGLMQHPGPQTPPRPPKPGLTDPRKLNVEGLDYADLDLVNVAEEEEEIPIKPDEQTEYADILKIPSLRHESIS